MQNLLIAFLLWCSCAPLTSPEGSGPGDWHEPEVVVDKPSALESYLVARRRYGTGPRPDFVAVVPFITVTVFALAVVFSWMTIASAPSGTGPPVKMRTAWFGHSVLSYDSPAGAVPTTSSVTGSC